MISPRYFMITKGVNGSRSIRYGELAEAPVRSAAVGEHLANGAKRTGLAALVALAIPLLPFLYFGLRND